MVVLSRIYTKTGDDGTTSLGDGTRVRKDDPRIAALGEVDEVNARLGILLASIAEHPEKSLIESLLNELFDVGADLCAPWSAAEPPGTRLRITPAQVMRLEQAIDRLNTPLKTLHSFVLPGGCLGAAWAHLARSGCRSAERQVVRLSATAPINPCILQYLNRLSDLLFVLARTLNQATGAELLWQPGSAPSNAPSAAGSAVPVSRPSAGEECAPRHGI